MGCWIILGSWFKGSGFYVWFQVSGVPPQADQVSAIKKQGQEHGAQVTNAQGTGHGADNIKTNIVLYFVGLG